MKKTLLALAVLTAAGSAHASVNLYDSGGVTLDVSGAAEIQYREDYDPANDAEIRLDDGGVAFNTKVQINDSLAAIGYMKLNLNGSDAGTGDLYVGLTGMGHTLTAGRTCLVSDGAGVDSSYEFGSADHKFAQTCGSQVINYNYDNGSFYGGISTDLADSAVYTDSDGNTFGGAEATIYDAMLGYRVNGLDLAVFYYTASHLAGANGYDAGDFDGYWGQVKYSMDNGLKLAAAYGAGEYTDITANSSADVNTYQLLVAYSMGNTSLALGHNATSNNDDDSTSTYFNVTQKLHSNVKVYGEVAKSSVEGNDFGYAAGMEVSF